MIGEIITIKIKTNDYDKLYKELVRSVDLDNKYYLNYDIFNKIIEDKIKNYPVSVDKEDDCLKIIVNVYGFSYPFELFFEKYGDLVSVTTFNTDEDRPFVSGFPFDNNHYYFIKNNKICNESELDRVIANIKDIINNKGNLYSYLFNLCKSYDDINNENGFNHKYNVSKDSSYDELIMGLCKDMPMLFVLLSDNIKNDKEILKKVMFDSPRVFCYFDDKYKIDEDIISTFFYNDSFGDNTTFKEMDIIKYSLKKVLDNNPSFIKNFLADNPLCYPMMEGILDDLEEDDYYYDDQDDDDYYYDDQDDDDQDDDYE